MGGERVVVNVVCSGGVRVCVLRVCVACLRARVSMMMFALCVVRLLHASLCLFIAFYTTVTV